MQTPITGDTFAFSTFHFHLKEHSVDCAKKGDENKNTEYCRLHSECSENCKLKSQEVDLPVWVMRVRVSEVIPGWVHKRVHGVSLSLGWAFTPDRRQRVGRGSATTKRIINLTNEWSLFASLLKWQIMLMRAMCAQRWLHPAWRPCRAAQLRWHWRRRSCSCALTDRLC